MTPAESAAKEAYEEAGVVGKLSGQMIADYDYEKWGGVCHVEVYTLQVTEVLRTWDEMSFRARILVEPGEAATLVQPILRNTIEEFIRRYSVDLCPAC